MVALSHGHFVALAGCSLRTFERRLSRQAPTTILVSHDSDPPPHRKPTRSTPLLRLLRHLNNANEPNSITHLSSSRFALNLVVADNDTTERAEALPAEAAVAAAAFIGVPGKPSMVDVIVGVADAAAICACEGTSSAPPNNSLRRSPGDLAFSIADVEAPGAAIRGATPALSRAL